MLLTCCCGPTTCARIIFTGLCDRTDITVTKDGVDYPVTFSGSQWRTALLESGTYTWTVASAGLGRILEETGTVTITCPQSDVTVTVPVRAAAGYVVTSLSNCCQCGVMPEILTMNVDGASDDFQDCTFEWMPVPADIDYPELGDDGFFSTDIFTEPDLDPILGVYPEYRWQFSCLTSPSIFYIRKVYNPATNSIESFSLTLYSWPIGGSGDCPDLGVIPPPVLYENSCAPFAMLSGEPCSGCDSVCVQVEE